MMMQLFCECDGGPDYQDEREQNMISMRRVTTSQGKDLEKDYLELLRRDHRVETNRWIHYCSLSWTRRPLYYRHKCRQSIKTLHMENIKLRNNIVFAFMIISGCCMFLLTDFRCCKARSYHYWWIGWLSQFVGICLFRRSLTNLVLDGS